MMINKVQQERVHAGNLVIIIPNWELPAWIADELAVISNGAPHLSVYFIRSAQAGSLASVQSVSGSLIPLLLWFEKSILRQDLSGFHPIDIRRSSALKSCTFLEESDVHLDFWKDDEKWTLFTFSSIPENLKGIVELDNVECFALPPQFLLTQNKGIVHFFFRFLMQKRPLEIFRVKTGRQLIWEHRFQTLEYGLYKNFGFFRGAFRTAIRTIWLTARDNQGHSGNANSELSEDLSLLKLQLFMVRRIVLLTFRKAMKFIHLNQWAVFLQHKQLTDSDLLIDSSEALHLVPENRDGWADPFLVEADDKSFLFIEVLSGKRKQGHLSVLPVDDLSHNPEPVTVVKEDFHLSYPFVFQRDGEWWMMPESASDQSLRLYKAKAFPHQWEFDRKLVDGIRMLDTTPFFHNGKWWIFTSLKEQSADSSYDLLYLFHSNDFMNEQWLPHAQNPLITDSSKARMAGAVFHHNGSLIRPSQNCFERYGGVLNMNRIIELTETTYKEELFDEVYPLRFGKHVNAVHTINQTSKFKVFDGIVTTPWKRLLK
jgi:hypothetical protein